MRISYWSSDVCSSGLISLFRLSAAAAGRGAARDALCAARADREPLARAHGDGCPLSGRTWRIPCALSRCGAAAADAVATRSEEHTSELQSLMRISYAVFCLKKKNIKLNNKITNDTKSTKYKNKNLTER